ncbi:hypothetical protein AB0N81_04490 [Streptomyces sp. NPDC093510]|uniref:hypothetical protein n=1 Tax=Streptomyces sp. NPDC093510 TaxID=3155199 RepID=UPI003430A943
MLRDVSIVQQIGVSVLAVATVVWAVGLVRVMRKDRFDAEAWRQSRPLGASPGSRLRASGGGVISAQPGPPRAETVELTADERAAFAGLVRQFGEGRS